MLRQLVPTDIPLTEDDRRELNVLLDTRSTMAPADRMERAAMMAAKYGLHVEVKVRRRTALKLIALGAPILRRLLSVKRLNALTNWGVKRMVLMLRIGKHGAWVSYPVGG